MTYIASGCRRSDLVSGLPHSCPANPYAYKGGGGADCQDGYSPVMMYRCFTIQECTAGDPEYSWSQGAIIDCRMTNGCIATTVNDQECLDTIGPPPGDDPATCSDYEKRKVRTALTAVVPVRPPVRHTAPRGLNYSLTIATMRPLPTSSVTVRMVTAALLLTVLSRCVRKMLVLLLLPILPTLKIIPKLQTNIQDGSFSVGHFETGTTTSTTITDNGDGTSTVVKDKTTTNPDGSTSHSKTTSRVDNATGTVLNSHGTTDGTKPVEDDPDNYSFGNGLDKVDNAIDGDGEIASKFSNRFSEFTSAFTQSDIVIFMNSVFDFSGHDGSAVSTIDMGEWGTAQLDYSPYEGVLNTFGYLLIMCSFFVSYRLIIANK